MTAIMGLGRLRNSRMPWRGRSTVFSGHNDACHRPLEGPFRYLWLDAIYPKVREGGRVVGLAVMVDVTAFMDFPKVHWRKIHSTNVLE